MHIEMEAPASRRLERIHRAAAAGSGRTANLGAITLLAAGLLAVMSATVAWSDPPVVATERFFPGDQAHVTAIEEQDMVRIAPGGPGYLAVWEDQRPLLLGYPFTTLPLCGNGIDIYGIRLDPQGNPIDPGPIVICQAGQNQQRPHVAWNEAAQQWLVVFTTEQDDWYFFEHVVGVRVAADGTVIDTTPIMLRAENGVPANDYAESPVVASDGTQWLTVWQDILWQDGIGYPNIAGKRMAADGTVLDASPVVLFQHNSYSFGPIQPQIVWASDEWLLVWEHSGYDDILGRRLNAALQPLDPTPFTVSTFGTYPRVATNGQDFLVIHRSARVHRVTHGGVVLDPGGIALQSPNGWDIRSPDVAWDGVTWVTVNSGVTQQLPVIFVNRVSTGGVVLPPGGFVLRPTGSDQYSPTVVSRGDGTAEVCWSGRNISQQVLENIQAARLDPDNSAGPLVEASAGLRRQEYLHFLTVGDTHLAVFTSRGGGVTRIIAQRLDGGGLPIDEEPVEVASVPEAFPLYGDVAWNGTHYLFTWSHQGSIYGRRFDAALSPVDAAPVLFVTDNADVPGVGSIGNDFYLAYSHTFSGDQRNLKGFLVDGSSMTLATSPSVIGGGYVVWFPRVKALDGRYLVVWQGQANHDVTHSTTRGLFVTADGVAYGAQFTINSPSADAREPDLAVASDRAFVTYADVDHGIMGRICGRILNADGSFLTSEIVIADAPGQQRFTSCGFDGERFVAAWTDFRDVIGIEQLRGDIFAARVSLEGIVEDPGGFQITSGDLPEDLPQVAGTGGNTIVAYARLHGPVDPEVQRIGYVLIGPRAADAPAPSGEVALTWRVGPNPFAEGLRVDFSGGPSGAWAAQRIEIVSVNGRLVAQAALRSKESAWQWDGRGPEGTSVDAGIYFVQLTDESGARWTRKVTKVH